MVYLARDPNLGRTVAIKTLRPQKHNSTDLLHEARTVGQLQHPHIVPVFEIGEDQGNPYVVYEHVAGRSLKTLLREEGPQSIHRAVTWMIQIIDGIGHAHDHGIVHRDLKPSNIHIGDDHIPRLMDFGIATAEGVSQPGDGLWGSINYLAPELLHGADAEPASDIFTLGLILYEMVTGSPAMSANDPVATMHWIAHRSVAAPSTRRSDLPAEVDHIVQRALEKEPRDRYPSVWEMQKALRSFLGDPSTSERGIGDGSALTFVLRRIRRKADFPAVSQSIALISQKTASDSETSVDDLANIILKDYALTTKLLRLVNSSFYGQYGGHISTVSRAVVVLGLTQVRNAALSLLLFEHLGNEPQAHELREIAGRAFLAGNIGRRVASDLQVPEPERAFVCAMLYTLGQYLTILYFPEEHKEILRTMKTQGMDPVTASRTILGLSAEELGIGVARDWCLPDEIVESMRRLPGKVLGVPANDRETLRFIATFANELTDLAVRPSGEHREEHLKLFRKRFKAYISIPEPALSAILESALEDLFAYADAFNINLKDSQFYCNASHWAKGETSDTAHDAPASSADAGASSGDTSAPPQDPSSPEGILLDGIQDITQALLCNYALNDILVMVLETVFRGMGFTRVLLCIRDIKCGKMVARFGLGKDVDTLLDRFRFPLSPGQDIFSKAIKDHGDHVCNEPGTSDTIPDWHRRLLRPGALVLCPIMVNGVSLGLIYADREEADRPVTQVDLDHLNALRNQAALAIKQRS